MRKDSVSVWLRVRKTQVRQGDMEDRVLEFYIEPKNEKRVAPVLVFSFFLYITILSSLSSI